MIGPKTAPPQLVGVNEVPATYSPGGTTQVIPANAPVPEGYVAVGELNADGSQIIATKDSVSNGTVDLGQIGLGALGAFQLYQGYNAYKQGDYAGSAVNAGAGAAAIGTAVGSETAASALPVAGAVAGGYGLYKNAGYVGSAPAGGKRNSISTAQGAAAGAGIGASVGSVVPVVGTAVGALVGGLVGGAYGFGMSYFGSSKDKYQQIRDKGREFLVQNGVLTPDYKGTLADGSQFDFGKDGKGLEKLDFDKPLTGKAAAYGNVIAAGEGFFGRPREAMSMLYANGGLSNAGEDNNKLKANFQHFAQQRGYTLEALQAEFQKQLDDKAITQHEYDVYLNDAKELLGSSAAQPARSQTRSPGIGLDGRPVSTGMMRPKPSQSSNNKRKAQPEL